MSHEVETMFSAEGKVPWHGLGTVIEDEAANTDKALTLAGLDWTVEKHPSGAMFKAAGKPPRFVRTPGQVQLVRTSDTSILGTVGENYSVLQNMEAFEFGDDLLEQSGAHWITAGSLFDGKRVWMLAKLPDTSTVGGFEDEAVQPYILVTNGHDGVTGLRADVTLVRVVCNNTLTLALKGARRSVKIRHTKHMADRMKTAKDVLDIKNSYVTAFDQVATKLLNTKVTDRQFENILDKLVPVDEDKGGRSLTVMTEKRDTIAGLYKGKDDLQNIKGTRYGVLQAFIDYNDHHVKGRGDNQDEKRMHRILNGRNIGHEAFELLTR